jgi:hypothetical protein
MSITAFPSGAANHVGRSPVLYGTGYSCAGPLGLVDGRGDDAASEGCDVGRSHHVSGPHQPLRKSHEHLTKSRLATDTGSSPLILHICGDTADRLKYIRETGIECFHIDSKVPAMTEARRLVGKKMALMGGISNINTLRNGSLESVGKDVRETVRAGIDIIGPECAVPLDAPCENLKEITRVARRLDGEHAAASDDDDAAVEPPSVPDRKRVTKP